MCTNQLAQTLVIWGQHRGGFPCELLVTPELRPCLNSSAMPTLCQVTLTAVMGQPAWQRDHSLMVNANCTLDISHCTVCIDLNSLPSFQYNICIVLWLYWRRKETSTVIRGQMSSTVLCWSYNKRCHLVTYPATKTVSTAVTTVTNVTSLTTVTLIITLYLFLFYFIGTRFFRQFWMFR